MSSQDTLPQTDTILKWLDSGSINIFGRPFAGKDTQAQDLASLLNTPVIGGGEILRSTGHDSVKRIIGEGKLAPTDEYMQIIVPYFNRQEYKGRPLLLSSVGRWKGEESGIMDALVHTSHPLKAVVYLDLDEDEVRQRWAASEHSSRGQRDDDTTDVLEVRLKEFRDKTLPVIDFYRSQNLLIEVDASLSPEEVTREILTKLMQKASSK